jgi:hypothetical protein
MDNKVHIARTPIHSEESYRPTQTRPRPEAMATALKHARTFWLAVFSLVTFYCIVFAPSARAAIFDHVVAFVDDRAVTLSEFRQQYEKTRAVVPDISEEEVINTMVNRLLMLKEARQYKIEAPTEDDVIKEFIDLKVRAFITVGENEVEAFFEKNREQFAGKSLEEARGEIEQYLTEKELNARLKAMLADLRKKAYIKVQLKPGE